MHIVNTGLCSFGMSGKIFHAPFITLHRGFRLHAVMERSKQEAANSYQGVISYTNYEALLDDKSIELVIVNTPNYTHYDFTRLALLADKHVVVEKPFCITTKECDELINLAKEKNKLLSVFQNRRWDSDFQTVQQVVSKQLLGDIVEAEFHFDRFEEKLSPKLHKETPRLGAGLLYDLGSHLIDQALLLFGMPHSVFADLAIIRPISKVEDYMELILFYDSLRIRLRSSYLVREALPAYILHGSKGSFIKSRGDLQETLLKAGAIPNGDWGTEPETERGILHTILNGKLIREKIPTLQGNYRKYYDQLYNAITANAPLPVTALEGRNVIDVIEKAYLSFNEKRIVVM